MKIVELKKVPNHKIGRIILNNIFLEPHEYRTILLLAEYGFDIEVLRPSGTPKSTNADVMMFGTIWEMKALFSYNRNTIKCRFKKASHQSDHIIVDLRNMKKDIMPAENFVKQLFKGSGTLKRMILITSSNIVDITK